MKFRRRQVALVGAALLAGGLLPLHAQAVSYPFITANVPVDANPTVPAVNPTTKKVYIPASGANLVDVIDANTNTVTARIPTGSLPLGAAADPATNRIYVTIGNAGQLSVIDGATDTVTASINVGGGPNYVAVDPALHRAYVSHTGPSQITVVDTMTNLVTGTVAVGHEPQGIAVNTAANTVYVANGQDATVSVLDRTTNALVATIPVGQRPQLVTVDTTANRAYVANFDSNTVSVINGATNTVVATVATGLHPIGVGVNTTVHRLYVANFDDHTVQLFDTQSLAFVATLVPGGVTSPYGIDVLPAYNTAYVADNQRDEVTVISERIDTTPPHTTITSGPSSLTNSRSAAVTFTVSDDLAPPATLHSECQRDGGVFSACTSPVSLTGLADGQHTLAVRSIDESNNVEAPPASITWTVDGTAPDTSFLSVPPDPSHRVTADVSFTGTDNRTPTANLTYACRLDDFPDYLPCTSPIHLYTLLPGSHTFRVRATDQAGNTDTTPATFSWNVVDVATPVTTFDPNNGTLLLNTTTLAVLTPINGFATDDVAGIDHIDVTFVPQPSPLQAIDRQITTRLDPGHDISCSDETNTDCRWTAAPSVLPGVYKVYALATDRAGRVELNGPPPLTVTVI